VKVIESEPLLPVAEATTLPSVQPRGAGWIAKAIRLPTARGDRLRHLAESARLEERPDQVSLRLAIWGLSLSLIALLTWASLASIPEIAHGTGQITPESFEREVVHPDAGRVIAIEVATGVKVKAGHPIVRLDTDDLRDRQGTLLARQLSLQLLVEALSAFAEGRQPAFAGGAAAPEELAAARAAYDARVTSMADQRGVLDAQAEQVRTEGEILDRQIAQAAAGLLRLSDLLQRNETLFAQKLLTYPVIAAARQDEADARAALDVLVKQKQRNVAVAAELAERIAAQVSASRAEAAQNLQVARADLAQAAVALAATARAIESRTLRAPVDGTVHLPDRLAVGDSIAGGQAVAYLIPAGDRLVARIRIPAREISQISIGQKATLRITSFDYLKFGRLKGEIVSISPAALTTDGGEVYYTAEVALESQALTLDGVEHPILPGMVVTADIINGSRTVLEYFLKPVNNALSEAFRKG
jgi:HlyD family type I secretion membrane fusion protein